MKLALLFVSSVVLSLAACAHGYKHGADKDCKKCMTEGASEKEKGCKEHGGSCGAMMGEGASAGASAAGSSVKGLGKSKVSGDVKISQAGDQVIFVAKISGLKPNSTHGFHIHEKGDCNSADGSSAGGHFNPANSQHGGPSDAMRHAGDLGNLKADAKGVANLEVKTSGKVSDFIGRAFIVHAKEDDFKTQPTGGAGDRVACGVVSTL